MIQFKSIDIVNMDIFAEDERIGKVKGVIIDPEE